MMETAGTDVALSAGPSRALPWSSLAAFVRFCRREPLGALGLSVLLLFAILAIFAPIIAPYDYAATDVLHQLARSSLSHPLGTDNLGRDVLSRLIWGARVELLVGLGAVAIAGIAAILIGTLCGYLRGALDLLLQRAVDVLLAFPGLILLITIVSMFQPGQLQVTVAIAVLLFPSAARVVRSAALATADLQYVEAARSLGATDRRILLRHILPNVFAPTMVTLTTFLGLAILLEATLSFLGYGVPPPQPSWGSMIGPDARRNMLRDPWLSIWPGIAIFLAVYSFNVLGDALRDELDPRLRGARNS